MILSVTRISLPVLLILNRQAPQMTSQRRIRIDSISQIANDTLGKTTDIGKGYTNNFVV